MGRCVINQLLAAFVVSTLILLAGCEPPSYTIGGDVTGVSGQVELIEVNAGLTKTVTTNDAPFIFDGLYETGDPYDVQVLAQPAGQTCTVRNSTGIAGVSSVGNINVKVYCCDDGTYAIGCAGPAGGIVYYTTNGGLNGLEAAPADLNGGVGARYGCMFTLLHAGRVFIGAGEQNTLDILAGCEEGGIAAKLADDYELNGFDDWFLPSQDELNELYYHRVVVGGFSDSFYWTSSELNLRYAWFQQFSNGNKYNHLGKSSRLKVRAVRAF